MAKKTKSDEIPLSAKLGQPIEFLQLMEEYIISLGPHPKPQTQRASAYGALAHGAQPKDISLYESLSIAFFKALFWVFGGVFRKILEIFRL